MISDSEPSYVRCFASLALGLAPFNLLFGISAVFGANTVTFNGQFVHGAAALVVCLVINLAMPAFFAGLQKLGYLLLRFLPNARAKGTD